MQRRRAKRQVELQSAAAAVAARIFPALTPVPVDDWVLRGHADIAQELERRGEFLAGLSPLAIATLLTLVEQTLGERYGMQGWTLVSSALPEASAMVLAWHREYRQTVLEYAAPATAGGARRAGEWFTLECERIAPEEVLAWRPLPPDPASVG